MRMGLVRQALQPRLQPEEGCSSFSSAEEDVADMALRFRVRTQKQQLHFQDGGGGPRLQHVVDKPIAWGPTVMPLASVLGGTRLSEAAKGKRNRVDIQGARDSFELKCVLSVGECQRLVEAAEAQGFDYWAKETENSGNGCDTCNDNGSRNSGSSIVSTRANHNYRSAYTLEVEHSELADLIWVGLSKSSTAHYLDDYVGT